MSRMDNIRIFIPDVGESECKLRGQIDALLNCSAYKLVTTDSQHARDLCSMIGEIGHSTKFAALPEETLSRIIQYMAALLHCADAVEDIREDLRRAQ